MEQKGFNFEAVAVSPLVDDELKVGVEGKPEPGLSKTPKIYSVSQLTREVRGLIDGNFSDVWVSGEISNFRAPGSGHFYFTLKDEAAQLAAVMFRGTTSKLLFKIKDGMEVICHGRLTVYELRGTTQIVVDHCEPKGIGALQLAFEQLKEKLQAEGFFDAAHKKKIPFLPEKIGVVTSPTGAAIRDIFNILERRFPEMALLLVPVKVQGDGAGGEIAEAIRLLNQRDDIDVIIVGRGGGSLEDLWAFNEEVVARAIFDSRIPVISAVGHEIDFTIADFVADLRAPTPSAAAELVVPKKEDLLAYVAELHRRLLQAINLDLEFKQQSVDELILSLKDPTARFVDWFQRITDLRGRLNFGWEVCVDKRSQLLAQFASNLDHLSPLHILAKGYSVVALKDSTQPLLSANKIRKGNELSITLHEGKCLAKVTDILV